MSDDVGLGRLPEHVSLSRERLAVLTDLAHRKRGGTGLVAATSRIGAAGGAFLLSLGISHLGIGPSMVISAGVCAVRLAVI